jgi:Sulfatase
MEWALLTGIAAVVATTFDALLLERKSGLFGGGYLAETYLHGPIETVTFLCVSLVVDATLLGLLVAPALWIASRLRLNTAGRSFLTLSLALLPVVAANFISYELFRYLGDLLNLSVLFDLTDRSAVEMLAMAMPHLLLPVLALAAAVFIILGVGWALNHFIPAPFGPELHEPRGHRRVLRVMAGLFLVGMVALSIGRLSNTAIDAGLARKPSGQALSYLVQKGSDIDQDGFGLFSRPADPDPWNAAVSPFALDLPGNGVDENGVGGDLPAASPAYEEGGSRAGRWARTPPVVLVILETYRANLLNLTVDGKAVTPILNGLAASGTAASLAFSHNGFTVQSRYHIFTGSLAGLRGSSLIDDFKANGYETAFFSAQDESFGGDMDVGFDRADVAYDARQDVDLRFSQFTSPGSLAVPYTVLLERVTTFLARRDRTKPLFLHLNFQDAHFPYVHAGIRPLISRSVVPRRQLGADRAHDLRSMYLNTAANVDWALGQALERVRRTIGEEPAVIVTSDHGESLFEDGALGHGFALNDYQTRIPLVASGLPVRLIEPIGQSDLRDAIWKALESPSDVLAPSVVRDSTKHVFQYIGVLRAPKQIALRSVSHRVTYHVHRGVVRFDDGPWRKPESLDRDERREFLRVVQTWERMKLAQAARRSGLRN